MGGSARLKLLLDTHIWLWLFRDPKRLGQHTFRELQDTRNELWLSPISTWEALTLHHKGRVNLHWELAKWVAQATAGMKEAVLTHEIMTVARQLSLHHAPSPRMTASPPLSSTLTRLPANTHVRPRTGPSGEPCLLGRCSSVVLAMTGVPISKEALRNFTMSVLWVAVVDAIADGSAALTVAHNCSLVVVIWNFNWPMAVS